MLDAGVRLQMVEAIGVVQVGKCSSSGAVAAAFGSDDGAMAVDTAADAVSALKVLLATEVASQLGVTITLSDSDGDS